MKLHTMSKNIVDILTMLSKSKELAKLLYFNVENPMMQPDANLPKWNELIRPSGVDAKIFPFPFDPDGSTSEDGSFIRVYYNDGEFNSNETVAESVLIIDVIVSNNLWLINNTNVLGKKESLVRPYEIAGRVIEAVGRRSVSTVKLNFTGYKHHYVNTQFQCIRLYADYMSVEA